MPIHNPASPYLHRPARCRNPGAGRWRTPLDSWFLKQRKPWRVSGGIDGAFTPDGKNAAIALENGSVTLYRLRDRKKVGRIRLQPGPERQLPQNRSVWPSPRTDPGWPSDLQGKRTSCWSISPCRSCTGAFPSPFRRVGCASRHWAAICWYRIGRTDPDGG